MTSRIDKKSPMRVILRPRRINVLSTSRRRRQTCVNAELAKPMGTLFRTRPPLVGQRPYTPSVASSLPATEDDVEAALSLLRAAGGRVTTARRALLEVLYEASDHRTAEELAADVHERLPDVHMSTIYRNLEELERLGVVAHAHLGHGPATYHLASSAHGHLVCARCGWTTEVPDRAFAGLSRDLKRTFGFTIDPRHFALLGVCEGCG